MIYYIWYPSGGFGHYINSVLSLYGNNFVRPKHKHSFGSTGDSHYLDLVLPKYFQNTWKHDLSYIDPSKNYSMLIDNGINDESEVFIDCISAGKVIKICYSDQLWPVVAKTQIIKASRDTLDNQLKVDHRWPERKPWSIREKYFLYLRDHELRHAWRPSEKYDSLDLQVLLDYEDLYRTLSTLGILCDHFGDFHASMLEKNHQFFSGIIYSRQIIKALKDNRSMDIGHITSLWDQAVINYFIYLEFDFEIPANTYADWFTNTEEMLRLI